MKYVMLVYQCDAQERQAALPADEQQQLYDDYEGIRQMSGVTPYRHWAFRRTRPPSAWRAARP